MTNILKQIHYLKNLLSNNRLELVISGIKQIGNNQESIWIQSEITLISARYQHYSKQLRLGLLDYKEEQIELSKIRASLISIMDDISKHTALLTDEHPPNNEQHRTESYYRIFNEYISVKSAEDFRLIMEEIEKNEELQSNEILKLSSLLTETINLVKSDANKKSTMSNEEKKVLKQFVMFKSIGFIGIVSTSIVIYFLTGSIVFALILGFLLGALSSQLLSD